MDILTLLYGGIALFLVYMLYGQFKFVKIYCHWFSWLRVLILALAVIMLGLSFFVSAPVEIWRNIGFVIIAILFALMNDGISDLGVSSNGTHITWKEVTGYDIHDTKKGIDLLITFNMMDKKGNVTSSQTTLSFDGKQKDGVKSCLENHIKKKYRRMK